MDDPGLAWPFWKFGLKKQDLYGKLHDKYNTFPSSIQDPEAFHHDVFEVSHQAGTIDEFYRLLSERKTQRLSELNDALQSAAVEIIANPSLIGTSQWQHAIQLFRTKSFDSIVRYFASYLPQNHPWSKTGHGTPDSLSETCSSVDSSEHSQNSTFDDNDGQLFLTNEPLEYASGEACLPASPRSMTVYSDYSASSIDVMHNKATFGVSASAGEPLHTDADMARSYTLGGALTVDPDDVPPLDDFPTWSTDSTDQTYCNDDVSDAAFDNDNVFISSVEQSTFFCDGSGKSVDLDDIQEIVGTGETPTPKAHHPSSLYLDKNLSSCRLHGSVSPSRSQPLSPRLAHRSPKHHKEFRWDETIHSSARRRSPGIPATRIEKPTSGRKRPQAGRRQSVDC